VWHLRGFTSQTISIQSESRALRRICYAILQRAIRLCFLRAIALVSEHRRRACIANIGLFLSRYRFHSLKALFEFA
jgi:hypothetical protein